MNQIQLDKLLLNVPALKADPAALKLVVAEVYNGQIQQLTGGQHQLKLPTANGPLQITLPANLPTQLQGQVKVQFQSVSSDQLQLTLQPGGNTEVKVALSAQQTQQLLFQLTRQVSNAGGTTAQLSANTTNAATDVRQMTTLPAQLMLSSNKTPSQFILQVAGLNLPLTASTNKALSQLLPSANTASSIPVTLHIPNKGSGVMLQLQPLPANLARGTGGETQPRSEVASNTNTTNTGTVPSVASSNTQPVQLTLKPAEYQHILQQLSKLVNQQQPVVNVKQGVASLSNGVALPAVTVNTAAGNYQLQLQLQAGGQSQLVLQPAAASTQISVAMQDINRPVQLAALTNTNAPALTPAAAKIAAQAVPEQLQQAWRNLLPLLPDTPDSLAEQPDLPAPVQAILQIIKRSQPDGGKTLAPAQLVNQLASLLQFQPLQNSPSPQTNGGTLALAIQLLLGHLQQKPVAPATTANARLAQLVSQLEQPAASNLLRQLASHSSTLQQSQLSNIDSSNPQQQLLLQLPLHQNEQSVFTQLQIEQREADGKQQGEKQSLWQLTMKFDLQQYGHLLVVARLQQAELQLQFYTDESSTQQLTEKFLPLLKDRCNAQGLAVTKAECVLGKIPDSLVPRANSLVTIRV